QRFRRGDYRNCAEEFGQPCSEAGSFFLPGEEHGAPAGIDSADFVVDEADFACDFAESVLGQSFAFGTFSPDKPEFGAGGCGAHIAEIIEQGFAIVDEPKGERGFVLCKLDFVRERPKEIRKISRWFDDRDCCARGDAELLSGGFFTTALHYGWRCGKAALRRGFRGAFDGSRDFSGYRVGGIRQAFANACDFFRISVGEDNRDIPRAFRIAQPDGDFAAVAWETGEV